MPVSDRKIDIQQRDVLLAAINIGVAKISGGDERMRASRQGASQSGQNRPRRQETYVGVFAVKIEAARGYGMAVLRMFGEFASLIFDEPRDHEVARQQAEPALIAKVIPWRRDAHPRSPICLAGVLFVAKSSMKSTKL